MLGDRWPTDMSKGHPRQLASGLEAKANSRPRPIAVRSDNLELEVCVRNALSDSSAPVVLGSEIEGILGSQ